MAKKTVSSLEEAEKAVGEIGRCQRELADLQNDLQKQIESLKKQVKERAQKRQKRVKELLDALFAFAQKNRSRLTEGGKKTVDLSTGQISWRKTPLSVSFKNKERVVQACEELGLERFLRLKKEPDKEAMRKEADAASEIPGVSVGRKEEFVVKPSDSGKEATKKVPLKKEAKRR